MGNCFGRKNLNIIISFNNRTDKIYCKPQMTFEEIIKKYLNEYLNNQYDFEKLTLTINGEKCKPDKTLESYIDYINSGSIFQLYYDEKKLNDFENNIDLNYVKRESYENDNLNFNMEINIEFFRTDKNNFSMNYNGDLFGLLKLCLLKEIAKNIDFNRLQNIPKYILNILTILKNGVLNYNSVKVQEGIIQALKKINGGNIINFSKYVDGLISQSDINNYLIRNLDLNIKNNIIYIQNCLGKYKEYEQLFEKELNRAKINSVFEYSIISSTIIEVQNIDKFEENRKKCKNRQDRVLFHGTSYDAISKILPGQFLRSEKCVQHGKGVYFTEDLDSCWIYGSETNFKDPKHKEEI